MVNQCVGVAEALAERIPLSIEEKVVRVKAPWKWITPYIRLGTEHSLSKTSDRLDPPYPDIIFSCGRQAIAPAIHIKEQSGGKTKLIHIQNPVISPRHFDALVVPLHDRLSGPRIIETLGAPHKVTLSKLEVYQTVFPEFLQKSPEDKRVGVLIGGACRAYPMDSQSVKILIEALKDLLEKGCRLLISPSRRTPDFVMEELRNNLLKGNEDRVYLWDMTGENPYFSLLANADALLVTCDSVCMITEACVTDRPVYLFPLKGGNKKFSLFHGALLKKGRIQWYELHQSLDFSKNPPFSEGEEIVNSLQELIPELR